MNPKFETKNITIVILSVILAAAIISGSVLYLNNTKIKENLEASEKKLQDMNKTLIPSKDTMIENLQEKLKKSESDISDLDARNTAIENDLKQLQEKYDLIYSQHEDLTSDYKETVNSKEHLSSQLQKSLESIEGKYEEEKTLNESLRSELASKNSLLASLQDEITKNVKEIERLQIELLDTKGERVKTETEMGRLKSTYDQLISDLRTRIKNNEVEIETYKQNISVTFVDSILFDSGKAVINSEGREILRKVGDTLKEVRSRDIRIIGHTDNVPIMRRYRYKFPTNWELSAARAAAVARYFQNEIGLDPTDLEAVGRSSYQPIAGNETEQGRARNRRVTIIIGPKIQ